MTHKKAEKEDPFLYIDDLTVGQKFTAGSVKITAEEIIEFGKRYDPQVFHTDPVAAKDSAFGQLVASGWQTAGIGMTLFLKALPKVKGGMIGRGAEKIDWPRPVLPGDELSVEIEVLELKISDRRPDTGIMRTRNTTYNQKGEIVMRMETTAFVPRRK